MRTDTVILWRYRFSVIFSFCPALWSFKRFDDTWFMLHCSNYQFKASYFCAGKLESCKILCDAVLEWWFLWLSFSKLFWAPRHWVIGDSLPEVIILRHDSSSQREGSLISDVINYIWFIDSEFQVFTLVKFLCILFQQGGFTVNCSFIYYFTAFFQGFPLNYLPP